MSYFAGPTELDCFVGGLLRRAAVDPWVAPRLAEASLTLSLRCSEPDGQFTVMLFEPVTVLWNDDDHIADVELTCPADVLDLCLRGEMHIRDALACERMTARGRVSKVLKLVPVLETLFPHYRSLVAAKDRVLVRALPRG